MKLEEKIRKMRTILERSISERDQESLTVEEILYLSQQLDKEIIKYYSKYMRKSGAEENKKGGREYIK